MTTGEAAVALELPVERVEQVLAVLLTMDPVGIGARDLRECLLTQLHVLRERGKPYPLAEELVSGSREALGEHHFLEIGRDLHRTSTQVKQAWYFIRSNLNPFPAHAFEGGEFPGVAAVSSPDLAAVIKPDVVMRRTATGFEAEVMEERRFTLGLNPTYLALSAKRRSALMSEQEDHQRPYSDEDLAALLGERGLSVARRTVAKYRESMRILPSRFRI